MVSNIFGKHPFFKALFKGKVALVPRGFLKFYVLRLLSEKNLSGAEIMEEIESRSLGLWKPSPGAIYPLLSWLSDEGYVKVVGDEGGVKRYTLTDKGREFLDKYKSWVREHVEEKSKSFGAFVWPPLIPLLLAFSAIGGSELSYKLKEAFENIFRLRLKLEEKFYKEAVDDFVDALIEFNNRLKNILKKFWGD